MAKRVPLLSRQCIAGAAPDLDTCPTSPSSLNRRLSRRCPRSWKCTAGKRSRHGDFATAEHRRVTRREGLPFGRRRGKCCLRTANGSPRRHLEGRLLVADDGDARAHRRQGDPDRPCGRHTALPTRSAAARSTRRRAFRRRNFAGAGGQRRGQALGCRFRAAVGQARTRRRRNPNDMPVTASVSRCGQLAAARRATTTKMNCVTVFDVESGSEGAGGHGLWRRAPLVVWRRPPAACRPPVGWAWPFWPCLTSPAGPSNSIRHEFVTDSDGRLQRRVAAGGSSTAVLDLDPASGHAGESHPRRCPGSGVLRRWHSTGGRFRSLAQGTRIVAASTGEMAHRPGPGRDRGSICQRPHR